jgi:hypothetical protein
MTRRAEAPEVTAGQRGRRFPTSPRFRGSVPLVAKHLRGLRRAAWPAPISKDADHHRAELTEWIARRLAQNA